VKNQINGKVTTYYRYIDCDKIIFENPSSPSSQIPQVPRFTYTNNDVGINENLDYSRQLDCTHLDGYSKQSKIIQTHTDSRIKNTVCEPGNLENLGISVNLDSKTNIQEIVEQSEESNLLTTPEGMAKAWEREGI
jgi:flagellar biosynthesis/type III secretory pathway M-ring protein FliF/YscJ